LDVKELRENFFSVRVGALVVGREVYFYASGKQMIANIGPVIACRTRNRVTTKSMLIGRFKNLDLCEAESDS
jgi:hypothetical protein